MTLPEWSLSRTNPWSPAGPGEYSSGRLPMFSIAKATERVSPGSTTVLSMVTVQRVAPSGEVPEKLNGVVATCGGNDGDGPGLPDVAGGLVAAGGDATGDFPDVRFPASTATTP